MMLSRTKAFAAATGRPTTKLVIVCASSNGSVAQGATVKVVKDVKVFHVPKHTDGLSLQGMQGTVISNVAFYKEKHLSANLPWKVQFGLEKDGTTTKFFAHLVSIYITVPLCICITGRAIFLLPDSISKELWAVNKGKRCM